MDTARYRLLKLLREADAYDRFRIYTPVSQKGQPIYVHAKIMVVDDRLPRVGSSNFNNRSMGFDTECDLAIEADAGVDGVRATRDAILDVRHDLLAEHLATSAEQVMESIRSTGSLIAGIEALRNEGRTLLPYEPDEPAAVAETLPENELLDPEQPPSWTRRALQRLSLRGSLR